MKITPILYLPFNSDQVLDQPCSDTVASICFLGWFIDRLNNCRKADPLHIIIDHESAETAIEHLAKDKGVRVFHTVYKEKLPALMDFVRRVGAPQIALLTFGIAFAPDDLLDRAYQHHLTNGNNYTHVVGFPAGSTPIIYDSELILTLYNLRFHGMTSDPGSTIEKMLSAAVALGNPCPISLRAQPYNAFEDYQHDPADLPAALHLSLPEGLEATKRAVSTFCAMGNASNGVEGFRVWNRALAETTRETSLINLAIKQRGYELLNISEWKTTRSRSVSRINFDFVAAFHLLKKQHLFFVQIGAFDGVSGDPIHNYVKAYSWSGVLVEPRLEYFHMLKNNYNGNQNLKFVNAAIFTDRGRRRFYTLRCPPHVKPASLPDWWEQLGSFNLDTILAHRDAIPQIDSFIQAEEIECITMNDLITITGRNHIDLLQIDAEGYDYEIIKMIDFERTKPSIIHFEHKHLSVTDLDECVDWLIKEGYRIGVDLYDLTAYLENGES